MGVRGFFIFLVTSVVLFNIGPVTPNRINGLFDSVTKPRQIPIILGRIFEPLEIEVKITVKSFLFRNDRVLGYKIERKKGGRENVRLQARRKSLISGRRPGS